MTRPRTPLTWQCRDTWNAPASKNKYQQLNSVCVSLTVQPNIVAGARISLTSAVSCNVRYKCRLCNIPRLPVIHAARPHRASLHEGCVCSYKGRHFSVILVLFIYLRLVQYTGTPLFLNSITQRPAQSLL